MVMDRFYFSNGDSAGSLEEFLEKLKILDDEVFYSHVNDEKNDFAPWIEFCVKDKVLAKRVSKLKDRVKIFKTIERRLKSSAKAQKNIIEQIKGAILDE